MEIQKNKSNEIYYNFVNVELSKTTATKNLKVLNLNANAIKLIIELAIVKNGHDANVLDVHDLSRFHPLIRFGDIDGIEYPDFSMCKRNKIDTKN